MNEHCRSIPIENDRQQLIANKTIDDGGARGGDGDTDNCLEINWRNELKQMHSGDNPETVEKKKGTGIRDHLISVLSSIIRSEDLVGKKRRTDHKRKLNGPMLDCLTRDSESINAPDSAFELTLSEI
jgi:hypothetical protein